MHRSAIIFLLVGLWTNYGTCQENLLKEADLVPTRIKLTDGSEKLGYLIRVDGDSLAYYDPTLPARYPQFIHLDQIDQVVFHKGGHFWKGVGKTFLISESVLLVSALATIPEDDYFGKEFYILLGNMLIVAPLSIVGGITSATPKFRIDVTDSADLRLLQHSKLQDYFYSGKEAIRLSDKELSRLERLDFSINGQVNRSKLDHSPHIYLTCFSPGVRFNNVSKQITKEAASDYEETYHSGSSRGAIIYGASVSYWDKVAIRYIFQPTFISSAGFNSYNEIPQISANFDFTHTIHQLFGEYRWKTYQNGLGNNWQFSTGIGLSVMRTKHDGRLSNYESETKNSYYSYTEADISPGLGLSASADYFLSKNVSLRGEISSTRYSGFSTRGLQDNSGNTIIAPVTVRPMTTSLMAALRFQL